MAKMSIKSNGQKKIFLVRDHIILYIPIFCLNNRRKKMIFNTDSHEVNFVNTIAVKKELSQSFTWDFLWCLTTS